MPDKLVLQEKWQVPDKLVLHEKWQVPDKLVLHEKWQVPDKLVLHEKWQVPDKLVSHEKWQVPDTWEDARNLCVIKFGVVSYNNKCQTCYSNASCLLAVLVGEKYI